MSTAPPDPPDPPDLTKRDPPPQADPAGPAYPAGQGYPQQPGQPYGQPYGGYPAYPQGAYPSPYGPHGQGPAPKNHTTRNVLLIVGGVLLLFCGGAAAVVVLIFNGIESAFDDEYPGSRSDPVTVAEGQAFEIRGFEYDAGWSITSVGDEWVVDGLRTTNRREDEDPAGAQTEIRLYQDDSLVGTISCSGASDLDHDRTALLACRSSPSVIAPYDEIRVFDDSFYE